MKRFALTLLVSLMVTSAHAGDDKFSLFRCGLQFGDSTKVSKAYTATNVTNVTNKKQRFDTNQRVGRSIVSIGPDVTNFKIATSNDTAHGRIPRTFTFAKFVCSWN